MVEIRTKVDNQYGIHCRPSATILKEMIKFEGTSFSLETSNGEVAVSSIMDIMAMGITDGEDVIVRAYGGDEDVACRSIADLIATNFDFKR